jgi:hypothetical protein
MDPGAGSVLYVDGSFQVQDMGMNQSPIGAARETDIGASGSGRSSYFYGIIDEVRVFTYAKSAAEISIDYSNGKAGMP